MSKVELLITFGFLSFLVAACGSGPQPATRYELRFRVVDDSGTALPQVPIAVGNTKIGDTGLEGILLAEVRARDGDRFGLRAPCPMDYETLDAPEEVVFLNTRKLGGEKTTEIDVLVVCRRLVRVAALLIHAQGYEGLPILIDGVRGGLTGSDGFAHLRLEGRANTEFEISLDTSAQSNLVPRNPRKKIRLGEKDGIFIFEPALSEQVVPKRRKRLRRGRRKNVLPNKSLLKRPIRID